MYFRFVFEYFKIFELASRKFLFFLCDLFSQKFFSVVVDRHDLYRALKN
jgi:hypothetical protein